MQMAAQAFLQLLVDIIMIVMIIDLQVAWEPLHLHGMRTQHGSDGAHQMLV